MMPWTEMMPIAGVAIDVFLIALVGVLLHRLTKDPTKAWQAREERLTAIHDSLRLLVSQAEGQARTLDADLTVHTERLRGLLEQAAELRVPTAAPPKTAARREDPAPQKTSLRAQVAELAASGLDVDEIADEMNLPLAEARLLVGLERSARDRAQVAHAGGQE